MNRIVLIIVPIVWAFQLWGQSTKLPELQYISPKPGSKFVMPGNKIALRYGEPFDPKSLSQSLIEVRNAAGDKISGRLKLSTDYKTLIYKPDSPFSLGETIFVELKNGLMTKDKILIQPVQFEFTVTSRIIQQPEFANPADFYFDDQILESQTKFGKKNISDSNNNNLPDKFPEITVLLSDNPSNGYYFITPADTWSQPPEIDPYIIIMDLRGIPVYYRKMEKVGMDLKIQANGNISFFYGSPIFQHVVMDSSFNIIDYYKMENGYPNTDFHDFQLLENGHAFVMCYDYQLMDMSMIVPGGDTNATVAGFVFQELDIDKEVIFQWRSWDHFEITDATDWVDLTGNYVDYVHGNTIEIVDDSSIIVSCRNMDEITKINRNTGDIIWRLGGKNNQFEFLNDTLLYSMQHDSRINPFGNLTMFDNGTQRPGPKFSSAIEYEMDEIAKTITQMKRLRNSPDIHGHVMGNAQWHPDESVVVGWGSGNPDITEFTPTGEKVYEVELVDIISYRAYRFPWKSNYFLLDADTLQYGFIWHESTLTKELMVINNTETTIELSSYHLLSNVFSIENEFPISVQSNDSIKLMVTFSPDSVGEFRDLITLNSDINSDTLVQRIAQQFYVLGASTQNQYIDQNFAIKANLYPNPAHKILSVHVKGEYQSLDIKVYNSSLTEILSINTIYESDFCIDVDEYISGIYLLQITEKATGKSSALKFIKK